MHGKLPMALWIWKRNVFPTSILIVCIFILITTTKFSTSLALEAGCSLRIQLSPLLNHSSCGAAFDAYLYALGQHANLTGKVFLDSTEHKICLSRIKGSNKDDIFGGCGIESLTSGGSGGCSDFLVADVRNKLGNEIRSLDENCQLETTSGNKWELQSCPSCLKTWKSIGETDSRKTEADLCRIAVLVTLISSKIENEIYVHTVLRCLGAQHIYTGKSINNYFNQLSITISSINYYIRKVDLDFIGCDTCHISSCDTCHLPTTFFDFYFFFYYFC